jgi:hypothetical protein
VWRSIDLGANLCELPQTAVDAEGIETALFQAQWTPMDT